jgi:hydrogenase maturation protein HypF
MFAQMRRSLEAGETVGHCAAQFHAALARAFAERTYRLYEDGEIAGVALSGGCFQNAVLLEMVLAELAALPVPVMVQREVPAGDGGLALGQAVIAAARGLSRKF